LSDLCFSPDGTFVAGGKKSNLAIFDFKRGKPIRVLEGHSGEIMSVAISEDGHLVATGKTDWSVALWDLNAPPSANTRKKRVKARKEFSFIRVVVNEYGNLAAVLHKDDFNIGVTLWDPLKLRPLNSKIIDLGNDFAYNPHYEHGLCLSNDGKYLATGMFRYFNVWNAADAQLVFSGEAHGWVDQLKFSADRRYIYLTNGSAVTRWNLESQSADSWMNSAHKKSLSSIDLNSSGNLLVSGGFDDIIYLTDIETQKITHELRGHESWIVSVKFMKSPRIMSASSDHTLMVWDVETGRALRRIDCGAQLKSALLMANDRYALTIAHDDSLAIWDLLTGELCRKVFLVSEPYSIAVAGSRLLLTDKAGVLRAIDIFKGKESIFVK
jgi:WD40 repeat protein